MRELTAVTVTTRVIYDIDAQDFSAAIEKGVQANATARMTDDCKKGIAKFLEKKANMALGVI